MELNDILSASSWADCRPTRFSSQPRCHVAERSWCCQALLAEARVRLLPILRPVSSLLSRSHPACALCGPRQAYGRELSHRADVDPRRWSPVRSENNGGAGVLYLSLLHLFKHVTCRESPLNQSGTFCSHDPLGPACCVRTPTVAR